MYLDGLLSWLTDFLNKLGIRGEFTYYDYPLLITCLLVQAYIIVRFVQFAKRKKRSRTDK